MVREILLFLDYLLKNYVFYRPKFISFTVSSICMHDARTHQVGIERNFLFILLKRKIDNIVKIIYMPPHIGYVAILFAEPSGAFGDNI